MTKPKISNSLNLGNSAITPMLIAMVIAVRQALDYTSTARAVGVCAVGWIAQAIIVMPVLLWFGEMPEPR